MTQPWTIRRATARDAALLGQQRVAMFRDMGRTTREIEPALLEASHRYLTHTLASGEYVGWVAELREAPGTPVGGAGLQFRSLLPRTDAKGETLVAGREGLILNVYVIPEYRRKGIAKALMETVIAWAPGAGIVRLVLHASDDGRSLYQALGFRDSNEMLFPPFPTAKP